MFKRFFQSLANLSAAVDALRVSVEEARNNFRQNLGLDDAGEAPQLEHEPAPGKGRKRQ